MPSPLRGRKSLGLVFVLTALAAAASVALAAGTAPPPERTPAAGGDSWRTQYDQGMELVKSEKYTDARRVFETLAAQQSKNADVLNMLAYTQRKTGDLDAALENYAKALQIRPKFPQAREYLGEAYLQAALREAETLKGYGDAGAEDLRKLADAFQEAAAQLEASRSKDGQKSSKW